MLNYSDLEVCDSVIVRASSNRQVTILVNAFVDATAYSGPACK